MMERRETHFIKIKERKSKIRDCLMSMDDGVVVWRDEHTVEEEETIHALMAYQSQILMVFIMIITQNNGGQRIKKEMYSKGWKKEALHKELRQETIEEKKKKASLDHSDAMHNPS
ncbi:hypothetical protein Tco_0517578 [Tanacetum coccineum]